MKRKKSWEQSRVEKGLFLREILFNIQVTCTKSEVADIYVLSHLSNYLFLHKTASDSQFVGMNASLFPYKKKSLNSRAITLNNFAATAIKAFTLPFTKGHLSSVAIIPLQIGWSY